MTSTKTAIRNMFINDATYLSLMGSPSDTVKHTYYLRAPVKPTFPEVIFSIRPTVANQSFSKEFIVNVGTLLLEVWVKTNDYESIADRIIYLLNHTNGSTGFRAILSGEPAEIYNADLNVYGLSLTFDLHMRRATI